jgi:hypothetical protein
LGYGHVPASLAAVFEDLTKSQDARDELKKPPKLSEFLMMVNWMKEGIAFNSLGGRFKVNPSTASK